ncbi:MAG TPA: transposase family protein [Xenococcaceae cyanobacterium]
MSEIAILEAFSGMPDHRRKQGTRHSLELCLALFTLAVTAGNQGFLAIGDWHIYFRKITHIASHTRQLH